MGLDNGITLWMKKPVNERIASLLTDVEWEHDPYDENLQGFDLLYWRKCWNVRYAIAEVLNENRDKGVKFTYDTNCDGIPVDCYSATFGVDVLERILDKLREDVYSYEAWGDSIWDWHDPEQDDEEGTKRDMGVCDSYWYHLTHAYQVLEILRTLDPGSYEIEFYDSY